MYNSYMDYTFIKKGENMELIELTEAIEKAKNYYELSKTEKEAAYYKAIIEDLRSEKQEQLKNIY